jgi:hypothetical protein
VSLKAVTYYTIGCDEPGCHREAFEEDEFTAWKQPEGAAESFDPGSDWQATQDGRHFCPDHRTWSEDEESELLASLPKERTDR